MASLENKVVILTGCSSGIGLATAKLFLERQAHVFGVDIAPLKEDLSEKSTNFSFHQTNLAEPEACSKAVAACIAKFGPRIDVLVNCAGVMDSCCSADTIQDWQWDRVILINLTVPVRLMTAVMPSMKEHKGGSIINVASVAGVSGGAAGIAYTASKHGLVGATRNVAFRFRHENIRCNAVLPGGVATGIQNSIDRDHYDHAAHESSVPFFNLHFPAGVRKELPITVDDIARSIAFLASDDASKISGALLPVDSAWTTA